MNLNTHPQPYPFSNNINNMNNINSNNNNNSRNTYLDFPNTSMIRTLNNCYSARISDM